MVWVNNMPGLDLEKAAAHILINKSRSGSRLLVRGSGSSWRLAQKSARRGHAMLSRMRLREGFCSLLVALALVSSPLEARVRRVEISSRTDVLQGRTFGDTGSYERIVGRIYFSVAVSSPHNRRIVDLNNAVNLKNCEVEFSADFMAIRASPSRNAMPDEKTTCGAIQLRWTI